MINKLALSLCAGLLPALALALALALAMATAHADLEIIEEAMELAPVDIRLTSRSSGRVLVTMCDDCDPVSLIITRDSRAFRGREPLPMEQTVDLAAGGGTVFYDAKTKIVTRIVIWD